MENNSNNFYNTNDELEYLNLINSKKNSNPVIISLNEDDNQVVVSRRGRRVHHWFFCGLGQKNSPGPFEIANILGKEKTMERIRYAISSL